LLESQQVIEDARGLLDELPPMSPDHEDVRLAVVKLRQTQRSLSTKTDLSSKALANSRNTVREARTVVEGIRSTIARRSRRSHESAWSPDHRDRGTTPSATTEAVTVFLDMDTVLLAKHQGRYGPELGLQADLADAISRLFEVADKVVVVVNPPSPSGGYDRNAIDTAQRLKTLREGLSTNWDGLDVATCEHGEQGTCDCAKPGHGLITRHLGRGRRADNGWYIGGDQEGMVAGRSAGLRTIRIGPHAGDHLSAVHSPDYEARDLLDAANHVMTQVLTAP
jgi:histidinol phosphatase-like enzyme